MTVSLLLLVVLGAVAAAATAVDYLRREPAVRGRGGLLALRLGVLVLLLALLLDPAVPGGEEERAPRPDRWVLVDAGPALDVPAPGGEGSLRELVVARAVAEARGGARLALAGPEPEGIDTAALAQLAARARVEDLRPSLLRLAEAGADSVLVLSPFRMRFGSLERAFHELPVAVAAERVGEPVRNAGVLALELPRRVAAGDPVEGALVLFGEGGAEGDSIDVVVEAGGTAVERRRLPLPPPGTRERLDLRLPPAPDTGIVRYTAAAALDGDVFGADDLRVRWVRVGPPEGGIVVVSLLPDWEPRALLAVLESATGLEGEGYLRVGEGDRWLPLGAGGDPAAPVGSEAFRGRLSTAALLVVHGADVEVPDWLARAAESHARVIHLPVGPAGARIAGLSPAGTRGGEWRPDPELPASPVAPFLAGVRFDELPPLTDLRPPGEDGGTPVLRVRSTRGGEALPALILRERPEGRRAVALAEGFWRWGHRPGPPREVYRGLWSGVAGWLLEADGTAGIAAIRPVEPVVARGEGLEWAAPDGAGGGTLTLRFGPLEAGPAAAPEETRVVELDAAGRGRSDPLPPGRWRWEGLVEGGAAAEREEPGDPISASGEVEVEGWSGALVLPPLDSLPAATPVDVAPAARTAQGRPGRPLRTHPLPYLLLLGLLCTEWILRRRVGLR